MKKCLPMRQLQPETRESLAIFQNANPIIRVFFSLYFDLLYQRGIKSNIFGDKNQKVSAYETATATA